MGYIRLEEHSEWGSFYLALPGKGRTVHGTVNRSLGLKFQDGQRVHIRWPDNSQSEEVIKHRKETVDMGDHGRSYVVRSIRHGVELQVRGMTFWVSLADLWVLEEDVSPPGEERGR